MRVSDVTPDWIRQRLKETHTRQKDLAAFLGLDHTKMSKTLAGTRQIRLEEAELAIEFFARASLETGDVVDQFVLVPRYKIELSGGLGRSNHNTAPEDYIPFTRSFLLKKLDRGQTRGLVLFDAVGDSMEPIISSGDLVMVDQHERTADGSIMAFTFGDDAYIKRVTFTPEGYTIASENAASHRPFVIGGDDLARFEIIGRVCWIGRVI